MSSNISLPAPPIFTGENFSFWAIKIKAFLMANDLWDIVENGFQPADTDNLTDEEEAEQKLKSQKSMRALTFIHSAVADSIFPRIVGATTSKQAWDILQEEFEGSERVRMSKLNTLRREFENLQMKESEHIKDFSTRMLDVVNQMKLYGEDISDKRVVEKLIVTLPSRFDAKVAALEESWDLGSLSITEVLGSLQAYEQRIMSRNENDGESAFQAKHKNKFFRKELKSQFHDEKNKIAAGKFPPCGICKRTNHLERYCWKNKTCSYCNKVGHIEKICRLKPENQSQQQRKFHQFRAGHSNKQQANFSSSSSQVKEEHLFMAVHCSNEEKSSEVWYLDSGCTSHMCNNSAMFTSINNEDRPAVKMGDKSFVQASGRGTIAVETKKGVRYINNVLLVPDLGQNLFSVAQMMKSKYILHFEGNDCTILDPCRIEIARIAIENDSFPLKLKPARNHAFVSSVDKTWLWHKRYGHHNLKSLLYSHSKEFVRDLPQIQEDAGVCECCQLGKAHRQPFPSSLTRRAKEKLELVHSDVCGPMKTSSLSNNRYFILFIDDLTRMTWVYFLSYKSQVYSVFKKFKQMVENQSGCKIKTLRTDNGKEYTSNEFTHFCEDVGIEHQLTIPYTPEQNGVCERKNRTVMEMARCMLIEKGMPKEFWAEAVYTAVYLLNRLPTKAIDNVTPIEAWTGNKPSARHLKVFGSLCYSHVPAAKRNKLSDKAEKGVFIGYSSHSKGYRIFNLNSRKVEVKRDVVFDEDNSWNWENKQVVTSNLIVIEEAELQEQITDVPSSSTSSSGHSSSSSPASSSEAAAPNEDSDVEEVAATTNSSVRKTKTLAEIYEHCRYAAAEPTCFGEAIKHEEWKQAMVAELEMIEKNDTWELTSRPKHKQPIGVKWIFKTKYNPDGSIFKHKARLVVKGYAQQPGIDYCDTFAPVARLDTVKLLIAISAAHNWKIFQLDVKSAFLNGVIEEEIYVEQPEGFEVHGNEDKVYKLHKALYGLKQAPRAWYSRIDSFLTKHEFIRSDNDATLYVKHLPNEKRLLISLYVDDLLVTGDDLDAISSFKFAIKNQFDMTDLGLMHYFLGMEIHQQEDGIFVNQRRFSEGILKKFKMDNCKAVSTPLVQREQFSKEDGAEKADESVYRSIIGSLLYLTATRPDLMYATSLLSRFMSSPSIIHYAAAKRVLRYIKGTVSLGLQFNRSKNRRLKSFVDSDWAGSKDDSKSTSGYLLMYGENAFCWNSKKQEIVAQSSAEAEYVAAASAASHVIWIKKILQDIGLCQSQATELFCDNLSAIAIAKNPVQHGRTKHIKVKYHFLREAEKDGEIDLVHCRSEVQLADVFTKTLAKGRFELLRDKLGMSSSTSRRSVGS